jgi:hypothetical protein
MTFIREMRRLLELAAAVTIAGSAFIAAPAQAANVTFSGCTSGAAYTNVSVNQSGDFTITCQAQNGNGTIAFDPPNYTVNAGVTNTRDVTFTRTGGSIGTAQSSASITSGGCTVAPGQVNWANGDAAPKTVTVTATASAATCILSGGWSTQGGAGNITATINVLDPNNPGTFGFTAPNSGPSVNSTFNLTVQRTGGSAGDWDIPFTATPTGLTGQTFTPASPLQFRGASDTTKTIALTTGSTPGTIVFAFGTPVAVGATPPAPAPTMGGSITVTVQNNGPCPTPGANVIIVGDMPAASGQHFLINGSAGQIMVSKLPSIAGFNAAVTQTSTQGTGPITNIEMAISKCPGDMDWSRNPAPGGAGQSFPWGGNVIYPCVQSSHILTNNTLSLHVNAINNASFCNVPNSGGPYYLNVRYEMPSCPYGNGICGASFQWNQ